MKNPNMLLVITTTITGLMAGLFFTWSVSVTPGIGKLPDKEYLASFQAMNRAIINPLFLICFLGTAILLPVCTFRQYDQSLPVPFWLLLSASSLYLIFIIGITFVGNIPLNNRLERLDLSSATSEQMAVFRARFENRWNTLNNIRTLASSITLVLAILACRNSPPN